MNLKIRKNLKLFLALYSERICLKYQLPEKIKKIRNRKEYKVYLKKQKILSKYGLNERKDIFIPWIKCRKGLKPYY